MDSSPYSTTSEIFAVGGEDYLKEGHTPTTLPERQDEILKLRRSLKPAARGAGAENTFLSGKAGQGKTAAAKAELAELEAFADAQDLDLTTVFFSCEGISSSYTLACGLCEELGGENPNGHPMQKVLDHLWDAMNDIGGTIIIVLDEIDNLGTDDKILYSPLVRAIRITLTTTSIRRSSALATTFNGVTTSTLPRKTASTTTRFSLRPTMRTNSAISFPAVQARRSVTPRSCMRHPRARRLRSTSIWMTTMVRLPRPSTK